MALSRRSAEFWAQQRQLFDRYAARPRRHFEKFSRWYAGDFPEVPQGSARRGDGAMGESDEPALANLTNLATRTFIADLMVRNPRFQVRPPGGYNREVFTPLLARIESVMLNDAADEVRLFNTMQMCLLDFILAPYMVGRVGLGFECVADADMLADQRLAAQVENQRFLLLGVGPRVKETDYHPVHVEEHEMTLAEWTRSGKVPRAALKYLAKHIEKHYEAMPTCRVGETRRNQSVTFQRVNPLCYSFDVFNEDPGQRTWACQEFLMRIEDAENNSEFSPKAVKELEPVKHIYRKGDHIPHMRDAFDVKSPDPVFRAFEYLDFVTGDCVLISENGTLPLLVHPWGHRDVLPSGPFIEMSLMKHPLHNYGISSPYIYSKHQEVASALAEVNTEAVLRSLPLQWVNGQTIGTEEIGEIRRQLTGGLVVLKNMRDGQKADDCIGNIPPIALPKDNVGMQAYHEGMVEKNNGGPARLGGGDRSETATASEVVSAANQILTDDGQAKCDEFFRQLGVAWLRLMRKYYPPQKYAEVFGEGALDPGGVPPEGFATRDILQDRGVGVVPGSTRRNSSIVEAKILQQQIALVAPFVEAQILPPDFIIELIRRSNEALGVYALDYDGAMEHMVEQQVMAAMGGGGGGPQMGSGPQTGPGAGDATRPSEASDTAGMQQSMANPGGGRAGVAATRADLRRQRKAQEAPVG